MIDLDVRMDGHSESPRNSHYARRMDPQPSVGVETMGAYLRYRKWKGKDDNAQLDLWGCKTTASEFLLPPTAGKVGQWELLGPRLVDSSEIPNHPHIRL